MTQNFILSEAEDILGFSRFIKLSVEGGTAHEQSLTLKLAISNNKKLKNVLWGLDSFVFAGDKSKLTEYFPVYFYKDGVFNRIKYLLSHEILIKSMVKLIPKHKIDKSDPLFKYNTMYQWQHKEESKFTIENVLQQWIKNEKNFNTINKGKKTFKYLKESFDFNFLSIIRDNPQVDFKIFYPPYSILTYKLLQKRKLLTDELKFKYYIYQSLKELKNVEIYDFQVAKSITHDLNNYKDLTHYHQKINTWILNQIKERKYLLKEENIEDYINKLKIQVENFNIEKIKVN